MIKLRISDCLYFCACCHASVGRVMDSQTCFIERKLVGDICQLLLQKLKSGLLLAMNRLVLVMRNMPRVTDSFCITNTLLENGTKPKKINVKKKYLYNWYSVIVVLLFNNNNNNTTTSTTKCWLFLRQYDFWYVFRYEDRGNCCNSWQCGGRGPHSGCHSHCMLQEVSSDIFAICVKIDVLNINSVVLNEMIKF